MKGFIAFSLMSGVTLATAATFPAVEDEHANYGTSTMRARDAEATGGPVYSDTELEEQDGDVENSSTLDPHRLSEYDSNGYDRTRTYRARKADNTSNSY
jgi:hypothetical protein